MTIPTGSLKRTADQLSLLTNSQSLHTQKLEITASSQYPSFEKMEKLSNTNYLTDSKPVNERPKSFNELKLECFNLIKLINIYKAQLNCSSDDTNQYFNNFLETMNTCSEEQKYMLMENTYQILKDAMKKREEQCEALTSNKRLKV